MEPVARAENGTIEVSALSAPLTVHKVLLNAADLIEQRGWTRGIHQDAEGRLCVHGAINVAVLGMPCVGNIVIFRLDEFLTGAWVQLRDYLLAKGVEPDSVSAGCIIWNDAPGRTKEEVLQALREAAIWRQAKIIEFRPRSRADSESISEKWARGTEVAPDRAQRRPR
jgi:hypothetical protein